MIDPVVQCVNHIPNYNLYRENKNFFLGNAKSLEQIFKILDYHKQLETTEDKSTGK